MAALVSDTMSDFTDLDFWWKLISSAAIGAPGSTPCGGKQRLQVSRGFSYPAGPTNKHQTDQAGPVLKICPLWKNHPAC